MTSRTNQLEALLAASHAEVQTLQAALREADARWDLSRKDLCLLHSAAAERMAQTAELKVENERLSARARALGEELLRLQQRRGVGEMCAGLVSGGGREAHQQPRLTSAGIRALRAISEVVGLVEALWREARGATLQALQRRPGAARLGPRELIGASNGRVRKLADHVRECKRLQLASTAVGNSASSLFSLMPFSSGAIEVLTPVVAPSSRSAGARVAESGAAAAGGGGGDSCGGVEASRGLLDRRAAVLLFEPICLLHKSTHSPPPVSCYLYKRTLEACAGFCRVRF